MSEELNFLDSFILQAHEGSLKTSQYAKEFSDLKMKVSFGMGMAARIPWISFNAPGMSTSNGYYPVYLYYKDLNILILAFGISETFEFATNWPKEIEESYQRIDQVINKPVRYGDSLAFKTYLTKIINGKVDFSTEEKESISKLNVVEDLHSILTIYKKTLDFSFNLCDSSTIRASKASSEVSRNEPALENKFLWFCSLPDCPSFSAYTVLGAEFWVTY